MTGTYAIDPNGAHNVFEALLAKVLERTVKPAVDLIVDDGGDVNTARLSQCFKPGRDVDAVTVDVGILHDHIAGINADAELDTLLVRHADVAVGHGLGMQG